MPLSTMAAQLLTAVVAAQAASPPVPVVLTSLGAVRGRSLAAGVQSFLGIRYAQAPVGALRYAAAVPAKAWAPHVLNATAYGPCCVQARARPSPRARCLNVRPARPFA